MRFSVVLVEPRKTRLHARRDNHIFSIKSALGGSPLRNRLSFCRLGGVSEVERVPSRVLELGGGETLYKNCFFEGVRRTYLGARRTSIGSEEDFREREVSLDGLLGSGG